tara:strand:+ start:2036 stop:3115 length:1080 start_codon:yes stop_codon:yes gene_type:complete
MVDENTSIVKQGSLAGGFIPMKEEMTHDILAQYYGITGNLRRFETEKDDTFQVTTNDNNKYVLKIANPDEDFDEIDFQHGILKHVEYRDPSLPVPRVIKNTYGNDTDQVTDIDGSKRYVRMFTFIEGTPLCETQSTPKERVEIGKMLAQLRYATEGFNNHPGENRVYGWDVQHLLTLKHLLHEVDDKEQRAMLALGLERFEQVEPTLRQCRQQVLHNDFSKSNIVVDHNCPKFVKGIIDFGDSVKTAIAVDVATALLNQLPETPRDDLFFHGRDIMEGYLSIAELTDDELTLIPHLVMARVVTRALLTLWRVKLFPENERYIMRNTEQGWHQLSWFLKRTPEQVSKILMQFSTSKGSTT